MKLSGREIKILYVLIATILIAFVYSFTLRPLIIRWKDVNEKMQVAKTRLHKSILLIQAKKDIDQEYRLYEEKLKSTGSNEQEMARMLNEIEKTARESSVKIISIRPRPAEEKDRYRYFEVEIETESQMGSLMRFLYSLKNSPQLLKVGRFSLSTGASRDTAAIRAVMAVSKIVLD
jgi:Tfp pilus assembly protein PilO